MALNKIKTSKGEHSFAKLPCYKYCKLDKRFCPLKNMFLGDGSIKAFSAKFKRWTDVENGTELSVDFSKATSVDTTSPSAYRLSWEFSHTPYSCWCDGSGFEYDTPPENVVGPDGSMNRLYDIRNYAIKHKAMEMSDWNAWLDKFQTDYRFGQISDLNATGNLFPNVDDPWMFTEYVFKGVDANLQNPQKNQIIIQPPLYDNELKLINADKTVADNAEAALGNDGLYKEKYDHHYMAVKLETTSRSRIKSFRKVCNWDEFNRKEDRRSLSNFGMADDGAKLYRANINVESVKWGEHGNVPPHTINMSAPKNWFDGNRVARIVERKIQHIGMPVYASSYGVLYWVANNAWVDSIENYTFTFLGDKEGFGYTYHQDGGSYGVFQEVPKELRANNGMLQRGIELNKKEMLTGQYVHGGCANLKSEQGCLYCSVLRSLDDSDALFGEVKSHFSLTGDEGVATCLTRGGNTSCPQNIPSPDYPILATFIAQNYNRSAFLNANEIATRPSEIGASISTWYTTEFETVYEDENPVEVYQPANNANGFSKGAYVIRGTGKQALNTKDNSGTLDGGDTFAFGDMDQTSFHRWFNNVMHCQSCEYCNEIVGPSHSGGFVAGNKAEGGSEKCPYYRPECPLGALPKRALEFQETMVVATRSLYGPCIEYADASSEERLQINYEFLTGVRPYYFSYDDIEYSSVYGTGNTLRTYSFRVYSVYCVNEPGPELGGIDYDGQYTITFPVALKEYALVKNPNLDIPDTKLLYRIAKIKTKKIFVTSLPNDEGETELVPISNELFDSFYAWYRALSDDAAYEEKWLVRLEPDFPLSRYNTVIIDNEEKFIGGFHPQYKDYTKRGQEFMQEIASTDYRDAMGDIVSVGTEIPDGENTPNPDSINPDHDGIAQPSNYKGYWVDADGDYIIDEIDLGLDQKLLTDDSREDTSGSSGVTISFRKSTSTIDGSTGKKISAKTVNCAVQTNDSASWITTLRDGGRPLFRDENNNEYQAKPFVSSLYALPTNRMAMHCPNCNYYLVYKYHDMVCPWCGEPLQFVPGEYGGIGEDTENSWPSDNATAIKKTFKIKSIGAVQVWGPPGMSVSTDAYFWKNPTVVTNSLKTQIRHRIGLFSGAGFGFTVSDDTKGVFLLGYPEQVGYLNPMPAIIPSVSTDYTVDSKSYVAPEDSDEFWYGQISFEGVTKKQRDRYASYNDIMPNNTFPSFAAGNTLFENIVNPYGSSVNIGLKMITAKEIKMLRNYLQPIMGYVSYYPAQDDYNRLRAGYDDRENAVYPRYYTKGRSMIDTQIYAVNESGNDSWVQFWSGDKDWGTVREYYPGGHTWWWLNKYIGGKYSDLTGGYYHFDGDNGRSGGQWLHSKAITFLHGIMPLDKEVLKAYMVVQPMGEPYKEPIGRGWNGVVHYEHYHAMTEKHYDDGAERHLHGQAGTSGMYDENGEYYTDGLPTYYGGNIRYMDDSAYYGWANQSNKKNIREHWPIIRTNFPNAVTNISSVYDSEFYSQVGDGTKNNSGLIYGNIAPSEKLSVKFNYLSLVPDDNHPGYYDLVQNYSKEEIWQTKTADEMRSEVNKNLVDLTFTVTDGDANNEISYDFQQWSEEFLGEIKPQYTQNIPGYFNVSDFDNSGRASANFKIGEYASEYLGGAIVVQGGGIKYKAEGISNSYAGSTNELEAGTVARAIDITSLVKLHYNDRIDRRFYCQAGMSWTQLLERDYSAPVWNGSGTGEDLSWWNGQNRYGESKTRGYLLTERRLYPKVDGIIVPTSDTKGDKYELAPSSMEAYFDCLTPLVASGGYAMTIKVNGSDTKYSETIEETTCLDINEVVSLVGNIFKSEDGFTITAVSATRYKIENKTDGLSMVAIGLNEVSGLSPLGLQTKAYLCKQNRVVSATLFDDSYHPSELYNSGEWRFESYINESHNFVMDLARAPLLESWQDYRYQSSSVDFSNCYCQSVGCVCRTMKVGVWALRYGKTMGVGVTNCPACNSSLYKADGSLPAGAVGTPSDGIMTYRYKNNFANDAYILFLRVRAKYEKCSYRVSIRSAKSDYWFTVFSQEYIKDTEGNDKYYVSIVGQDSAVYDSFSNVPENIDIPNQRLARYVRVDMDGMKTDHLFNYTVSSLVADSMGVVVLGDFSNTGVMEISGREVNGCKVMVGSTPTLANGENIDTFGQIIPKPRIKSFLISSSGTSMTIYFNTKLANSAGDEISFTATSYLGGLSLFEVYGTHYIEGELTKTEDYSVQRVEIGTLSAGVILKDFPTQIADVQVGDQNGGSLILTQCASKDDLKWTTTEVVVDTKDLMGTSTTAKFDKITGGNYYFSSDNNRIYLPVKNTAGKVFSLFEKELELTLFERSYVPTHLFIRYWSGAGMSITLRAQAEGQGPSYQLEKESITVIEDMSALPSNGFSTAFRDFSGSIQSYPIPWYCFNHEPCILSADTATIIDGKFKVPNFPTTILDNDDNDNTFLDLYGENCSRIAGRCVTMVTFYGAANQIVSGRIAVKALAKTTRSVFTGTETVVTSELTGGIKNGKFVTKVIVKECEGRKSLCFSAPQLIVYLREKN